MPVSPRGRLSFLPLNDRAQRVARFWWVLFLSMINIELVCYPKFFASVWLSDDMLMLLAAESLIYYDPRTVA